MRVALATVGTAGDVRPFATLGRALAERGHEVTAVTWPVHAPLLDVEGVEVRTAGPHGDPARIAEVAADAAARSPLEQVAVLRDFHLERGEEHYRRLLEVLRGQDVVLLHGIHALAHAAALDLGVRWATATFDPVLLPTRSAPPPGMPSLGPANGFAWRLLDGALARAGRPLDRLLAATGSAQRRLPLFRAISGVAHLVACAAALVDLPGDAPPTWRLTGAWLDRSPPPPLPEPLERFLAAGRPPVAITFGSMTGAGSDAVADAVDGIVAAGERVVIQGVNVSRPASAGSRVVLGIGEVDHRALFPRVAAVVHHGGAGTTHAACAAGVPSVIVPHVGDQRWWAERLHRLGLAPEPIPVRSVTGRRLARATLRTVADHEMRRRAADVAQGMRHEDGVATAVGVLEEVGR